MEENKMGLETTIQIYYVANTVQEFNISRSRGLYELLSGNCGGSGNSGNGGFSGGYGSVIIPATKIENGDVHDTYKIDRYGNFYGGHTTARVKEEKSVRLIDLPDIDTQ